MKILHTADWHVDTSRNSRLNPQTGFSFAVESNFECAKALVDKALEEEVDLFVLAGDLTTDGSPKPEINLRLAETLEPLNKAGIPVEVDTGNHEKLGIPARHRTNVSVVGKMLGNSMNHVITGVTLSKYDQFEMLTIPYPSKSRILSELNKTRVDTTEADALVVKYVQEQAYRQIENRDESLPLIVAGHFTVSGIGLPGSERDVANLFGEAVFPMDFFDDLNPAYVGLGHIHTPQHVGNSRVWYSGSPNKLTFTDSGDEKGGNLVTIDENTHEYKVDRIPTPVRGMYKFDLSEEGAEIDLDHYEENDCVQVKLAQGDTELPREIRKEALARHIGLFPVPNPTQREKTREVMSAQLDPHTALTQYLANEGYEDAEVEDVLTRARLLGIEQDETTNDEGENA